MKRCGASWAFSTAAVASDRFAIQSGGHRVYPLSVQNLLSCNSRGQQVLQTTIETSQTGTAVIR